MSCRRVVVRSSAEVLGLAKQIAWIRSDKTSSQEKKHKESKVWLETLQAIGQPPPGSQWVAVGDRGNDFFEFMTEAKNTNWNYVVRGKHDRTVVVDGNPQKLHTWIRGLHPHAEHELSLRARGHKFSRTARLKVSWGEINIPSPKGSLDFIRTSCVRASDPEDEALEWILLTSLKVQSAEDAIRVITIYEQRWIIEEYHKCLKTGCKIEEAQLKTATRLLALLGVLGIVATQLLWLRDVSRKHPDSLAEEYIEKDIIEAVKSLAKLKESITLTVKEFWRRVAMLGGFLGRKSDGNPG